MPEVQSFQNDKVFKRLKGEIERKTTPRKKKEIINKALKTKYFMNNEAAAKALLDLFQQEKKPKDISDRWSDIIKTPAPKSVSSIDESKKEPIIAMKGESISEFGHRLFKNGEYQRAMDLYLSEDNIKEYWFHARSLAKRYLTNQKDIVAYSIFDYLQKKSETALTLAECADHLWAEERNIARNIIIQWVKNTTGIQHVDISTQEKPQWWIKKTIKSLTNFFVPSKQTMIEKWIISVDALVFYQLMSAMEILWWCKEEMLDLYLTRVNTPAYSKLHNNDNLDYLIISKYEKSLKPTKE